MSNTAEALRIGVLGPLQVQDAAGRTVPVGGQRVRVLLILLALEAGRPVAARSLIERLWPDDRPGDAANALQSLVSRLRAALRAAGCDAGVIESTQAGYRLAVPPAAVDALAFEASARAGSQALADGDTATAARVLRAALAAWRGPALTDVAAEEFADAPAARLAELRGTAHLDRIDADLALGDAAAVIGELRALTAADPLAERPAALLMRALAATGRQSEALSAYASIRDQLADRLGVDPSPQLERVYLAILRQEIPVAGAVLAAGPPIGSSTADSAAERMRLAPPPPASRQAGAPAAGGPHAAAPPPHAVRRPPTSFVGRDDDVAGLLKKLRADRLVTLTGPGGVGKTRLAVELAARLDKPAWFAEFAPVSNPADVPYAVLDALGLRERSIARRGADPAGLAHPVDRIVGALAGRNAVLILDNCEHVVDEAARLADVLLAGCPRVTLLATSREPLRIPGEALYAVAPLPVPPRAGNEPGIPEISAYPAVRMFADRAAAVLPAFELDHASAAAVAQVCRALDGMPLAIELAAPWLRTLTPAQLAGRLDDRFTLLAGGSRTALPRHQTLRAVVDWSWQLLSAPERALARRLAAFPAGATLTAAEQACADPLPGSTPPAAGQFRDARGLARADVLPVLSGLVAKSILTRSGDGRYRMLETVRAYGLERLAEAGEETRLRDALAGYYLNLAETADPKLRTADQVRWFRELTAEQDNMHAALRWATSRRDAATALRIVRALGYYWVQRGHGEGDALTREVLALDSPPLTKRVAEARVICALLAASWSWDSASIRGPLAETVAALRPWLSDYANVHPIAAIAEPLLFTYNGDQERAMRVYEKYAQASDPWLRGMGLLYLASQGAALGRFSQAEDDCRAALREFRAIGERWGAALALTQLVDFTEARADHQASIDALAEATAIGRELGAWGDLSYVDGRLAVIRARTGDIARADAELADVERVVATRGGKVDTDRWIAFMRAEIAWLAGDLPAAAASCVALLAAIEANEAAWWQSLRAQVRARLAMAWLGLGERRRAGEILASALDAAAGWPEHPALAAVLDACAVYAVQGKPADPERAAQLLGAAHAIRGVFDESSPDASQAREAARAAAGGEAYAAAYRHGRRHTYQTAISFARDVLAAATPLRQPTEQANLGSELQREIRPFPARKRATPILRAIGGTRPVRRRRRRHPGTRRRDAARGMRLTPYRALLRPRYVRLR